MTADIEADIDKMLTEERERIDITKPVDAICQALGLQANWVQRLHIVPGTTTVDLLLGTEGRCQGAKYIHPETGHIAMETLEFRTRS